MNILSMTFIVGLLTATVRMMVPILLSALGETYSERAGILNIGLEGIMLISAFCAFLGSYYFNSAAVGVLFGAASGLLVGLVAAFLSVTLQINQMISGIASGKEPAGAGDSGAEKYSISGGDPVSAQYSGICGIYSCTGVFHYTV